MSDINFTSLNAKVDDLIALCAEMQQENQLLKDQQRTWESERQQLIEKNQVAKAQLQSVLDRLQKLGDF